MSLYDVHLDLLQTCQDALTAAGRPVAEAYIANGELAWDRCCNGLLAVVPLRIYPSRVFPTEDLSIEATFCGSSLVNDVAVVVLRCAPGTTKAGKFPAGAVIQESAGVVIADAELMARTISCWCSDYSEDAALRDTAWVGPEGGCVGSSTSLLLELPEFDPPDPDPDLAAYPGGYGGGY